VIDLPVIIDPGSDKRRVDMRIDPACARRWHLTLATTLSNNRFEPRIGFVPQSCVTVPTGVETLLSLEAMLLRVVRPRPAERLDRHEFSFWQGHPTGDVLIDLTGGDDCPAGATVLRPLYDGIAGEVAALAAVLAGHSPTIEIQEQPSRRILARAVPSLSEASTLNDAYGVICRTTIDLLLRGLADTGALMAPRRPVKTPPQAVRVLEYLVRRAGHAAMQKLYNLCCYPAHWRVGWRVVGDGDVWDHMSLAGSKWQSIRNPPYRFLADPFPFVWQGKSYVFAEDFDQRRGKGIISFVQFDRYGPCGAVQPVLEEPWHLSYPFLIEHGGGVWMVPEATQSGAVSVYRADPFPTRWVRHSILLQGISAADVTIAQFVGRFWMFAATAYAGRPSEALSLFSADDLFGPWLAHPGNPVLLDAGGARPAGNLVLRNGRLWRPVQDCRIGYGRAIGLAEVLRLDETGYRQVVRSVLRPGQDWPGRRLHTLNRAGNLECIDGSAHAVRGMGQ
jgi:hypothetical protein